MLLLLGACLAISIPQMLAARNATTTRPAIPFNNSIARQVISDLPIAVDGAMTPAVIPDTLAMRHFLRATAIRADSSPDQAQARDGLLTSIGFSQSEREQFVQSVSTLRSQLDALESERQRYASAPVAHAAALNRIRDDETAILDAAAATVMSRVGRDGQTRFLSFIRQRVKRHIKIYGTSPAHLH
jgi:hypothetical protein